MRRVTAILTAVVVAAGLVVHAKSTVVDQAKPNFTGEWKRDVPMGQGQPGVDLTITQNATVMTLEARAGGLTPAPMKATYKLDGSESRNTVAARAGGAPAEQVSKAVWAGNAIVVTTTTSAGEEKCTFSMKDGYLVVEIAAAGRIVGAPNVTKVTYQPYERGFGG